MRSEIIGNQDSHMISDLNAQISHLKREVLMPLPKIHTSMRYAARAGVAAAVTAVLSMTAEAQAGPPTKVTFTGGRGQISNTVAIPANAAVVWTSGTVPGIADTAAPAGSRARYGDTKTQAVSVLKAIEARLKEHGLGMKDVVYLRAYLVPDKEKGGTIDTQGWNQAYGEFFNNATNPVKPARSTVGVAALVSPEWLVEIEAFAVFPPTP